MKKLFYGTVVLAIIILICPTTNAKQLNSKEALTIATNFLQQSAAKSSHSQPISQLTLVHTAKSTININ